MVMISQPAKRILIVEDNKIDAKLLRDILTVHGYETFEAKDGLKAISLAWAKRPDLILMDVKLPDLSGLEVTRLLKKDDHSKHIPMIAVTAFAMEWHEREALDSGCDAYLPKPITIGGLLRAIEPFLSRFAVPFSPGVELTARN
jgi:two-component system cell cycle response regulator DivK